MIQPWLGYAIVLIVALACSVTSAETRGKPYTEEQLLENSAVIFVGEVIDTRTYPDYKRTVPSRARVLLSIKGKASPGERKIQPKDPGEFAYFDEEFTPAKKGDLGIFYVGTKDNPDLLLGYRAIEP